MSFLHTLNHFLLASVCGQSPLRLHFAAHGIQRPSKKVFNPYAWWISLYSSFALRHDEVSLIICSVGWFFDFVVYNPCFRVFFLKISESKNLRFFLIENSNSVCVCVCVCFQISKFLRIAVQGFIYPTGSFFQNEKTAKCLLFLAYLGCKPCNKATPLPP